jgi:hypothetical protein
VEKRVLRRVDPCRRRVEREFGFRLESREEKPEDGCLRVGIREVLLRVLAPGLVDELVEFLVEAGEERVGCPPHLLRDSSSERACPVGHEHSRLFRARYH